jgi:hypothetical protein
LLLLDVLTGLDEGRAVVVGLGAGEESICWFG